jgi:hypothetical protein
VDKTFSRMNARASQPTMRCVNDGIQATGTEARFKTAQ